MWDKNPITQVIPRLLVEDRTLTNNGFIGTHTTSFYIYHVVYLGI